MLGHSGAAIAMLRNLHASMELNATFLMHGAGDGASNCKDAEYRVAPGQQRFVACNASVHDQDYEGLGIEGDGFVLDGVQLWHTLAGGGAPQQRAGQQPALFAARAVDPCVEIAGTAIASTARADDATLAIAIEESLRQERGERRSLTLDDDDPVQVSEEERQLAKAIEESLKAETKRKSEEVIILIDDDDDDQGDDARREGPWKKHKC